MSATAQSGEKKLAQPRDQGRVLLITDDAAAKPGTASTHDDLVTMAAVSSVSLIEEIVSGSLRLTSHSPNPFASACTSGVTPVRPPPCHISSGSLPLRFFGRKYCTYICST